MQKIREEKCLNNEEHEAQVEARMKRKKLPRRLMKMIAEMDGFNFVDCMSEKGKAAYMAHGRRKD